MSGLGVVLSLVPAVVFLCALYALDTYRLLPIRRILAAISGGGLMAAVAFFVNTALHSRVHDALGYWVAPVIEELLKAILPLWYIYRHRVGFPVDAGILAFATGTGFAMIENLVYLQNVPEGTWVLWLIRGLGTAVMHGTATALVAICSITVRRPLAAVVGLLAAIGLHIFHNSGLLEPLYMAVTILAVAPAILALVFARSEQMLAEWLSSKLGEDLEVFSMIASNDFADSKAGRYLTSIRNSFPPEIVGDMLCLISLSVELSAQAKGDLLKRKFGFAPEPDPSVPAKLKELEYLERNIGPAGRLALAPIARVRSRDIWEMNRLAQQSLD